MNLSKRLNHIINLIDPCEVLVDIGTDHGYVLIDAIKKNKCNKAYGLDIASGPLSFAKNNIEEHGLENQIELMKLNGLIGFTHDADTFVIAGMGYETIINILSNYKFNSTQTIIVQSNTKQYDFRKELNKLNFKIIDEVFFYDNKKPVTILKLKLEDEKLSDYEYFIGPILKDSVNIEYVNYLKHYRDKMLEVSEYNPKFKNKIKHIEKYLKEKEV